MTSVMVLAMPLPGQFFALLFLYTVLPMNIPYLIWTQISTVGLIILHKNNLKRYSIISISQSQVFIKCLFLPDMYVTNITHINR